MRTLACIFAVALIGAAPANAAPFTPKLERTYAAANQFWGGEPAGCATVDRQIVPTRSIPNIAEATIPGPGEVVDCILYLGRALARSSNFELTCAVVAHEVGHLHGFEHSLDPSNIMYFGFPVRVPRYCKPPHLRGGER